MKNYESKDVRNVAVFGHGGSGKTTLTEALAFKTKLTDRMCRVEDKNTISDYDSEEQARQISISTSLVPLEFEGVKINLLDTPGYFDFVGEQQSALRAADAALILVDALSGVEVGAEKAYEMVKEAGIPAIIVVNKADRENVDFAKTVASIQELVGPKTTVFSAPVNPGTGFSSVVSVVTGQQYEYTKGDSKEVAATYEGLEELRDTLLENAASADEDLMMKYLEGEEISQEELLGGIKLAVASGEMVPIYTVSATGLVGLDMLLDTIKNYIPSPLDSQVDTFDPAKTTEVFIFKTIADPFVGKLSLFKVVNGTVVNGMEFYNPTSEKKEKVNHVYTMIGKKQVEVDKLNAGDIGAFSKFTDTVTNDLLIDSKEKEVSDFNRINFSKPNMFMSISPKSKGDEDKLGNGLARIKEEDLTCRFERNEETSQTLIYGVGEMHLDVIAAKLKSRYSVDVELNAPLIPYRETVKKKAVAEGKHKKQSGGSGQFGVVTIEFEPTGDPEVNFEFVDKVVGGAVPKQYIPAVEKGLRKAIEKGVLAGYPLVGLKASLTDGKYHPVDSDEMSFMTAASLAYKEGVPQAGPVLLEPIYSLQITIPDRYMGDIMGDMSKKRGRILGSESSNGKMVINAEAPLSELFKYATELRSMTQARGSFQMEFIRYEEVPAAFAPKIIEDAKAMKEAK